MTMGFREFSVSCVKRSANFVANSLAKYARQIVEELVWLEEPPPLFKRLCTLTMVDLWMNEAGFVLKTNNKKKSLS